MPKIDAEEHFLDLAEKFQKDYCLLRDLVVNTQFIDLSDDLYKEVYALYKLAQQIYSYISGSRQIGKYSFLAALSYFSCPNISNTQELSSVRYLILQASFLTYRQYQEFAKIDKAENKQKHVCDLFRYVSRYVLDSNHAELFQECSELLNRYVMYERNLKKEDRNQLFNIKDFKQVQAIEYLSALLIIFKRLDDRRFVHRQRKSKKSKVLQWPTKNELKKFREIKSGKYEDIGHNAKISIYDAALHKDEEGEVDLLDPEMEFYSEDEKSKNLNYILSDNATHLMRHRQRRHAPFVTNPHYLAPDILKQIVYVLRTELSGHWRDAAIAAACLLSLLTGLSPVALMDFNELIQDGILIQNGSSRRREYLLKLNLKITEQKIKSLNHVRWNEVMTHQLHLPSAWFDYIEQASNPLISSTHINTKLKNWLDNRFVGSITVEKLQAQLYFHIYYETYNEYLAHVIAGRDSQHHMPGIYYGGLPKTQLSSTYLAFLEKALTPHSTHFTEDTAELKILQQQFKVQSALSIGRIGSQLALEPNFVKEQFHILHRHCHENIQEDKHIINQLNAYACWMWHISLLSLASRPKKNLLGNLDDYCVELKLLYVNDKKNSKARKDGRFIPLSDFFIKTLQNYTAFLEQIIEAYGSFFRQVFAKKKITVNDLFGKVIFSKDILPITVKEWQSRKVKLIPLSRNWVNLYMEGIFPKNMYSNWLRHFDMNFLMYAEEKEEKKTALAFHLIQALYGHDQRDREAFHPYSSLIPNVYVQQVRQQLQDNVKSLSIKHLERK
ncbi:hypothetical protein [Acinetobacter baumannii]|uniref:hypothetical protein n=1 Tax=Acinetobacter baumannii TaxID=470 RepID=UPI00070AE49B|nr:hypothetical protein [Acinetobacter baumannii]KRI40147.1 hypothetical protein APC31_08970 [Acinetobacter baumannii]KRI40507.1 hypothetical protein APC31_08845 [Acinetobacter baumannii]